MDSNSQRYMSAAGLVLLICNSIIAQEPPAKRPMHERVLAGENLKRADALESRLSTALQLAGLLGGSTSPEAVKVAQELLDFRQEKQGADHWQVRDARQRLAELKRPPLSAEQKKRLDQAQSLTVKYRELFDKGQYTQAVPLAEAALAGKREVLGETHAETAAARNNLALLYSQQGAGPKAEALYRNALTSNRELLGDVHPLTATNLSNLALLLARQGEFDKAEPLHLEALRIRREVWGEMHPDTAASLNNLAELYRARRDYAKAEPLFEQAIRICRQTLGDNHPHTAASLNNLALVYYNRGDFSRVEPLYAEALRIRRKILGERHPDTATSLNNLAEFYIAQREYAKAEPLLRDALRVYREVLGERHPLTALALGNLAALHQKRGAFSQAEPLMQQALQIRREVLGPGHPETILNLKNLARLYFSQGDFVKAEPLERAAWQAACKLRGEDSLEAADGFQQLGVIYLAQGSFSEALTHLERALHIRREKLGARHAETLSSLQSLATLYLTRGDLAQAEPLQLEVLKVRREMQGPKDLETALSLSNAAGLYLVRNDFAKARPFAEEALQIRREVLGAHHIKTADSLNSLATIVFSLGELAEAERLQLETLRIQRELLGDRHPHTAVSLVNLAAVLAKQGKLEQAESTLAEAALAYEVSRLTTATGFDRAVATAGDSPYPLQAAILAARGKPREAFQALEFDLARALFDVRGQRGGAALTPEERKEQTAIAEQLAILQNRVIVMATLKDRSPPQEEELKGLLAERRELDARLSKLAVDLSRRELAGQAAIQDALPDDAALVAWLDIPSSSQLSEHWGCVVRSSGEPHWERLAGSGELGTWTRADIDLPRELGPALSGVMPAAEIDALAARLYAQRLAPLRKHLGGVKRLYAVSVRSMAGIPVESLTKDYVVSYVPSGSLLARLHAQPAATGTALLALGDPVFTRVGAKPASGAVALRGGDWKELPGTRVELSQITRLFGPSATALLDSGASEQGLDALRERGALARFRYLHFATHGEANRARAFDSVLILSQDGLPQAGPQSNKGPLLDGQLSAAEVRDYWTLDAELVTLSACETALGRDGSGEGMLGFAQAFLVSGARSVCLSLWKVDDTATALLMQRFYQNLLGKRPGLDRPMTKADALAEAKQWLRELRSEEAQTLTASMSKGIARGTRGKDEELQLSVPADDPKRPPAKDARPFAHPRYWAAFVLIGEP